MFVCAGKICPRYKNDTPIWAYTEIVHCTYLIILKRIFEINNGFYLQLIFCKTVLSINNISNCKIVECIKYYQSLVIW
jgi:hypothetical protein